MGMCSAWWPCHCLSRWPSALVLRALSRVQWFRLQATLPGFEWMLAKPAWRSVSHLHLSFRADADRPAGTPTHQAKASTLWGTYRVAFCGIALTAPFILQIAGLAVSPFMRLHGFFRVLRRRVCPRKDRKRPPPWPSLRYFAPSCDSLHIPLSSRTRAGWLSYTLTLSRCSQYCRP